MFSPTRLFTSGQQTWTSRLHTRTSILHAWTFIVHIQGSRLKVNVQGFRFKVQGFKFKAITIAFSHRSRFMQSLSCWRRKHLWTCAWQLFCWRLQILHSVNSVQDDRDGMNLELWTWNHQTSLHPLVTNPTFLFRRYFIRRERFATGRFLHIYTMYKGVWLQTPRPLSR